MIWTKHDGGSRWTYGDDRSDVGLVIHDWWGWWAYDLRFQQKRLLGYSLIRSGAQARVEAVVNGK